jgi:hypothetical protein
MQRREVDDHVDVHGQGHEATETREDDDLAMAAAVTSVQCDARRLAGCYPDSRWFRRRHFKRLRDFPADRSMLLALARGRVVRVGNDRVPHRRST